jgi:hypothetical protein
MPSCLGFRAPVWALVATIVSATAAGTSACLPKTSPLPGDGLTAEVTDRRGDARASARVPTPPDFIRATAIVSDGAFTLTVSFATGTLSDRTAIRVYLDTDEDAATGTVAFFRDSRPIGADYVIRPLQPINPARAALTREAAPSQSVFSGVLDVTSPAPDQRRFVVRLARLGNDDGRLRFKLECDQVVEQSQEGLKSTATLLTHLDEMPDAGAPPGAVR